MKESLFRLRLLRIIISDNLRSLRYRRNLSLEELSKKSGCDIITLEEIEEGKHLPSLSCLVGIATSLNVHLVTLLEE